MNEIACPHCGQTHPPGLRFCPNTGAPMPGAQTCPHCSEKVEADWEVCAYCGRPLKMKKHGLLGLRPIYWPLILALVGLLAYGVYWLEKRVPPSASPEPSQTQNSYISPTSTESTTSTPRILLPTANEGKIAFVASVNDSWQVFIINPDGTEAQQLTTLPQPGAGDPAISPDGTSIALVNDAKNIYTIGLDGSDLKVIYRDEVEAGWPAWSPDSKVIVFASRRNGSLDLFTMNPDGTELVQITDGPADDQAPAYSPDGTQIAFSSNRSGSWEVYILTLVTRKIEQITDLGDPIGPGWPAWSPDGLTITFESIGETNNRDIYTIKTDGTQLKNVTNDPTNDGAPVWSPDGKQIAFVSDRNNALNVYIMQNDGTGLRKLTDHWAWGPSWSMTAPHAITALLPSGTPTQTLCEANQWSIVPTQVFIVDPKHMYVYGGYEPDLQGFKYVVVPIAVENNSPHWGSFTASANESFLSTEDGFIYSPDEVSVTPEFPYLSETAPGIGIWVISSQLNVVGYYDIPPGFIVRGSSSYDWLHLVYKVAATQNHFVITIPSVSISCILPNGQKARESTGPILLNLDRDVRQVTYPTYRPDTDFTNITESIVIPNVGTIEFIEIDRVEDYRGGDLLTIRFKFTNASAGYGASGNIGGYLIGNDGLIRRMECCGGFHAGPGQSSEFQIQFLTDTKARDFKFLWISEDGKLEVYDLPEDYSALAPVGEIVNVTPVERPQAEGTSLGDPNASVLVEVWEDFQCPACRDYSQETAPQVVQNYVATGKVRYVFRHYPFIDDRVETKESDQAANASMCAAEQGRFWDYHDILFANWNGENAGAFNDKRLIAFAETIGLKMDDFNTCLDANRYKDQIDKDFTDGQQAGVKGTPSVFVNGVIVKPGFVPSYTDIAAAIDAALASQ